MIEQKQQIEGTCGRSRQVDGEELSLCKEKENWQTWDKMITKLGVIEDLQNDIVFDQM